MYREFLEEYNNPRYDEYKRKSNVYVQYLNKDIVRLIVNPIRKITTNFEAPLRKALDLIKDSTFKNAKIILAL